MGQLALNMDGEHFVAGILAGIGGLIALHRAFYVTFVLTPEEVKQHRWLRKLNSWDIAALFAVGIVALCLAIWWIGDFIFPPGEDISQLRSDVTQGLKITFVLGILFGLVCTIGSRFRQ